MDLEVKRKRIKDVIDNFMRQDSENKKNIIGVFILMLSLFMTYIIDTKFMIKENVMINLERSMYVLPLIIMVLYFSYKHIITLYNMGESKKLKRLILITYITGFIIGICITIGKYMLGTSEYEPIVITKKLIIYLIGNILAYTIYAKNVLVVLFSIFEKMEKKKTNSEKELKHKFLTSNKKSLLLVAIILFIVWIPTFLARYPGPANYDNTYQIYQVYTGNYRNDHPLLHTWIFGSIVCLGEKIWGNFNSGIALATVIKMILGAFACSYLLYYLAKRNTPYIIRIIIFGFMLFYQPIAHHVMIADKDVTFSIIVMLIIMNLADMVSRKTEYFAKKRNIIILPILLILSMFYRHNAMYAYVLAFPIMIILMLVFKKKLEWSYKKIVAVSGALLLSIVIYMCMITAILNVFKIPTGAKIEKYTLPAQIMGRVARMYYPDRMSKEEVDEMEKYLLDDTNVKEISEKYISWFGDPTKNRLDEAVISKNEKEFMEYISKLVKKYPLESVQAVLDHTHRYYSLAPSIYLPTPVTFEYPNTLRNGLIQVHPDHIIDKERKLSNFTNRIYEGKVAGLSIFVNIGMVFFFILTSLMYSIYKRRVEYILAFMPIVGIYITALLSPVGGAIRYSLPLFTTAIILFVLSLGYITKEKKA